MTGNVKITPKKQLPSGAVYETKTVDGEMVHTDTYYPAADGGTVLERTKKTTVVKAEHHRGMGPTDNQGVPMALRTVSSRNLVVILDKIIAVFDCDIVILLL